MSGWIPAFAGMTRIIANPDLVERLEMNARLNEPDPTTFYGGDAKGCTDYPTLEERAA